ncbi:hypothetical protein [Catalinimonas niigatensis]|uniref:hypothetical protein n=1 Tax=Catalinimonas niigatensis TaxID=1397264 RepID=UPI0026658A2C|nr:hypothetical protein [Catalinimonas niigatensis]WPP52915.1 hypothetical protein PZB72_11060 [Catalinimonas niigatensis]
MENKSVYSRMYMLLFILTNIEVYLYWISNEKTYGVEIDPIYYMLLLSWICISRQRIAKHIALGGGGLSLVTLIFILGLGAQGKVYTPWLFALLLVGTAFCSRMAFVMCYRRWRAAVQNRFIIIGYTTEGKALCDYLQTLGKHHRFLSFFDNHVQAKSIIGSVDKVKSFCQTHQPKSIYIGSKGGEYIKKLFHFTNQKYMYLHYLNLMLLKTQRNLL